MNPFEDGENADGSLDGLMRLVNRQYPGMLQRMMPSATEARQHNRKIGVSPVPGETHQETGMVKVPEEFHEAVCVLGRKLAKGIFYRETQEIFPDSGCLLLNWFTNADLIRDGKYVVFDLLKDLAGTVPPTVRSGKYLGDQFEYKLSLGAEPNVFVIQARFGGSFALVLLVAPCRGSLSLGSLASGSKPRAPGPSQSFSPQCSCKDTNRSRTSAEA